MDPSYTAKDQSKSANADTSVILQKVAMLSTVCFLKIVQFIIIYRTNTKLNKMPIVKEKYNNHLNLLMDPKQINKLGWKGFFRKFLTQKVFKIG